jgi:very-short-patch-repair endonuclease
VRRACDELVGGSLDAAVRRLRQALEARGVTGLVCEARFTSSDGASCYGDLWCPAARTLVEVDGCLTHAVRERLRADRRRGRWMLRDHGIATLRVEVADLGPGLDVVADELAVVLLARSTARGAHA